MSDITLTDLFAGAGGSSTGALQVPGVKVSIAANHWQLVCDIHALNHPNTDHAVVDLHQERPSFFPRTDMLWASPECTKWSQANGAKMPAIEEGLFEDPLSDDAKNRSRLLMFDVLRFIEHHRYRLVIVENVVDIATQAKYRTAWDIWRSELRALGYRFRVVSLNSMHAQAYGAPAPQSRDRIYVVAWPEGAQAPDLDRILRPTAWCDRCGTTVESVQSWKNGRTVGRYRQAYLYCCSRCSKIVEPGWLPAAAAIDWSLPGERIGDRLKPKTRARIAAGIARYWGPVTLEAAGNTYDATSPQHPQHGSVDGYYRTWPVSNPLRALHTTNSKALAVPTEGRDGKEALPVTGPMRTQTTRAETALAHVPFIAEMYGTSTARPVTEPAGTFTAGGNHHGLVTTAGGSWNDETRPTDLPLRTLTTRDANALVQPYYGTTREARPATSPLGTLTTVDRYALIHRMNTGGAEMTTPSSEELRTLTTAGHQAVLRRPDAPRITPADMKAAEEMVPEVLFRMFQPHEVAAGMAFPADYKWQPADRARPVSNRDLVKAAGNAVTPPAARDLIAITVESLGNDVALAA
ncbi:DNA cytosine methyltransferase [Frigoribacterium sp. VKM Ac-2530]|uniref:DNA cytosine methyltransferase n=1 Tax=Frigoribacterium sp. VKM Ac-2530 TaxID=2783822 RepID=UPI00188B315B|nr:DNA cytosine methyltransferase [Frigoribacterium sp. VKM Ac-2530]MBF4578921.1 DNA cytosine methyltransferase [Frigoribacterium sp. VKM Ac-2530]